MRHTILLIAAALLPGCHSAQTQRSQVDPVLASLIPADSVMLAGIRMDQVRVTTLYQKLIAQQRLPQVDDFARETGFDPRRDVRELLLASNGKDAVMMARGTFHPSRIAGVRRSSYKGLALLTKDQGGVALIDSTTAVAGPLPRVRALIDQYKAGRNGGAQTLLARAPRNQIWSVSSGFGNLFAESIPQNGNTANFARIFRSLENTTASADLTNGINGFAVGECTTEQDAKNLGDAARGLVGLARLSVPDNQPELLRLWDGIKVEQQQRTVRINVSIPQELVERVVQMFSRPAARASDSESRHPDSSSRRPR